jgi:hypothetical protein
MFEQIIFELFFITLQQLDTDWHRLGMGSNEETMKMVEISTDHSFISEIIIDKVSAFHSGIISCRPKRWPTTNTDYLKEDNLQFNLKVLNIIPATVDLLRTNLVGEKLEFRPGKNVSFVCPALGNPIPAIRWMKDGQPIDFNLQVKSSSF